MRNTSMKEQLASLKRYLKKKIDKHADNNRKIVNYGRLSTKLHSDNYKLELEIRRIEKEIDTLTYNVDNPHYISLGKDGLQLHSGNGVKGVPDVADGAEAEKRCSEPSGDVTVKGRGV